MKKKSRLKRTFNSLIIIFIIILLMFRIPYSPPFNYVRSALFPLLAVLALAFLIQGIRLILMARKEKGKLKLFLMLTGISTIVPLPGVLLHNLFYALAITFENYKNLFELLSVAFFIMAIVIAPIAFIVGVVGSLIIFKKDKKGTTAK